MPNSAQQYATGLVGLIGGMARGSAVGRLSHHGAGQGLAGAHEQGRGNAAYDYAMNGACENLSIECTGTADQALAWAIAKWWDFEDPDASKRSPEGTAAAGSPCSVYGIDTVTFGHHKALANLSTGSDGAPACRGNTVGFGVAPYTDAANPAWKWIVSSWTR